MMNATGVDDISKMCYVVPNVVNKNIHMSGYSSSSY